MPFKHPPKIPLQLQKLPVTKSFLESDENSLGIRKHGFVYQRTNKNLCILTPKIALWTLNDRRPCRQCQEQNTRDVCLHQYTDISLYWFLKAKSPFQSISEVCIKDQTSLRSSARHAYTKE